MEGLLLRFYIHERERHRNILLWEWLLKEANEMGVRGGSAFRAMAGFGRHHQLQENHFFELAGTLTIEVEFVVSDEEATRLLELVRRERLRLFHAQMPARFGIVE